jgi:SAM-dependent methyltransferase
MPKRSMTRIEAMLPSAVIATISLRSTRSKPSAMAAAAASVAYPCPQYRRPKRHATSTAGVNAALNFTRVSPTAPTNGEMPGASTAHLQNPYSTRCRSARSMYESLSALVSTPVKYCTTIRSAFCSAKSALHGASGRKIASCRVGDARALDRGDQSADIVLLLGPLYHLIDAEDRRRALQEAYRVLTPGGLFFVAAISRFASALDGLAQDLFADPAFEQIVQQDIADGIHENRTGKLELFTTAKFHRPEELSTEVKAAGFSLLSIVGLEGPGWLFPNFEERWQDPRRRNDLLRIARALESEPSIQAVSAHILAIARRDVE